MPLAVARDEAHAERLRLDGWAVEGPFVPEQHQGAVEALTKIARPGEEFGWSDKVCRQIAADALASLGGQ